MKTPSKALIFGTLLTNILCFNSMAQNQHNGPQYAIPSGMVMDPNSGTWDTAHGTDVQGRYLVTWFDRFNKIHSVGLDPGGQMTVAFPIPNGGTWKWTEATKNVGRTGFNGAVTWVEATFYQEDDHIRIHSTGHYPIGTNPDPDVFDQIKRVVSTVSETVAIGVKTTADAAMIVAALGL